MSPGRGTSLSDQRPSLVRYPARCGAPAANARSAAGRRGRGSRRTSRKPAVPTTTAVTSFDLVLGMPGPLASGTASLAMLTVYGLPRRKCRTLRLGRRPRVSKLCPVRRAVLRVGPDATLGDVPRPNPNRKMFSSRQRRFLHCLAVARCYNVLVLHLPSVLGRPRSDGGSAKCQSAMGSRHSPPPP